jgi:hypothetical protein
MASMTPELETYYNTYFDLFRTDGWKQLIEDLKQNAIAINSVEATKDVNDLYLRKGQLNVLAHIINLESVIENAFEEINQEPEEDV